MISPPIRTLASVGLVLLVSASCRDGTAPQSTFSGVYVAQSLNGIALPMHPAWESPSTLLVADTIRFDAQGVSTHSWTLREPTSPPSFVQHSVSLDYRLAGDTVRFIPPPCPPGATCSLPPSGILVGDQYLIIGTMPFRYLYHRGK